MSLLEIHDDILASGYHPWAQYRVGLSTVYSIGRADRQVNHFPRSKRITAAAQDLAKDPNADEDEVYSAALDWFNHGNLPEWYAYVSEATFPVLHRYRGDTARYFEVIGDTEITRAWKARGVAYAPDVRSDQWEEFSTRLAKAEAALEKGWELDQTNRRIPLLMMTVERGQGKGRDRAEMWFRRAMSLDPNNYDAVVSMADYLHPRWHGSVEDCLGFARQCVNRQDWGGKTSLVLARTHDSFAAYFDFGDDSEYWHRTEVWNDVKASYEKYLSLVPGDVNERLNFAVRAFRCGRYREFLNQLEMAGDIDSYQAFGGREAYDTMVAKARAESE